MINYFRTKSNGRSPKLFFVSSKSTTSTVTTTTNCYSTINSAATTCGRKKRAIINDDVFGISDQTSVDIEADAAQEDIVSGMDEAPSSERSVQLDFRLMANNRCAHDCFRQGKFLLYWLTTTATSTLTSFTGTTTLFVSCIPSGMNVCGSNL